MNGVHDLGGMMGFGPIAAPAVEPVFHEKWEGRMAALVMAVPGDWSIDEDRAACESIVDLVWGTSPPIFQGVTAWALARFKGAKFLFEVRDLWPQFAIAVGVLKNPILIFLSEWLERFLYRRADQVMVNSPGFLQPVTSSGAKRVKLIPNGADPSMFDPDDDGAAFRQSNQLTDKFVALYAGAHGMSNDLNIVLDAAGLLADEKNIQIVLIGDGKEKPALLTQAEKMNLSNVTFLPSVPKTEMAAALAGADACIAILKPLQEYKTTYPNKCSTIWLRDALWFLQLTV